MSTLNALRRALKKSKAVDEKNEVVGAALEQLPHISTGSIILDNLIGGVPTPSGELLCPGIPRGRITEIYGSEGSGKTTVALHLAVNVQRAGGSVVYLDYENAISLPYAQALGLDIEDADTWMLIQPLHWEEGAAIIVEALRAGVDLIVVDSVAAMVPKATLEKPAGEAGRIGLLAQLNSGFLPQIVKPLHVQNTALLLVNQVRSRIKTSMYDAGPDEDTSGGKAIKYYVSLRIKLQLRKKEFANIVDRLTGDKEKQNIYNMVRATMVKNKIAPHQGHKSEFVIRFGEGIDNIKSIMDIATRRGIIKKRGAWLDVYGPDGEKAISANGGEQLRKRLKANPAEFQLIVDQLNTIIEGVQSLDDMEFDEDSIESEEYGGETDFDVDMSFATAGDDDD